jgi:hypothetical protein
MDLRLSLRKFLNALTKDGTYYSEVVEDTAEIHISTDGRSVVLLEVDKGVYHVNFRSDLAPNIVAQISQDMIKHGANLSVGPCFAASQEEGMLYGDEAMGSFYMTVFLALQTMQDKDDDTTSKTTFVVKSPIYGYGINPSDTQQSKYKKMWGDNE